MRLSTLASTLLSLTAGLVTAQQRVCNNAAALCDRHYNNVTHLGAHDSPFVRNATNGYSIAGDQIYTPIQQLESGVRLLSAQVHAVGSQWRLCHTLCALYDAGFLVDWLRDIKRWMDSNPNEVVTLLLVNSDNANATTLSSIYDSANVSTISYAPSTTDQPLSTWPTLTDLITQNKRLISFIANLDPTSNTVAPYLLNEFTFMFENNYENFSPSDFSCEPSRPSNLAGNTASALSEGYLPLMNHFRYDNLSGIEVPSINNVNVTNAPSGAGPGNLGDSADNCTRIYGRAPTFILTDFSNVGPAIETVDRLNGVSGMTSGRLLLPDSYQASVADPSPSSSSGRADASSTSASSGAGTATRSTGASGTSAAVGATSSSSAGRTVRFQGGVGLMWTVLVSVLACGVGSVAWAACMI